MDHQQLKPNRTDSESSDLYNLGYVQNVIAGQVLAELVPLETVPNADPRFVSQEPNFPVGPNTHIDPEHPTYLLATCKGYVFYNKGLITVKKMLNVRNDVSFHTGNIYFVGDAALHGNVRAGFDVQADNILIKGMVEGGSVRAQGNLAVRGGARGGAGEHCLLTAGGNVRISFIEKVELRAQGNILIEKYCLHSDIYGGSHMVVKERLAGGTINCYGSVLVAEQLGNMAAVPTRIYMGYDPQRIRQLEKLDKQISELSDTISHLSAVAGHLPPDTNETTRKLVAFTDNRDNLMALRTELWKHLHLDEQNLNRCKLMVPGKIFAGVEIAIGRSFYSVETAMHNVTFSLQDEEIVCTPGVTSSPAKR